MMQGFRVKKDPKILKNEANKPFRINIGPPRKAKNEANLSGLCAPHP
jgi:hypothetical protein